MAPELKLGVGLDLAYFRQQMRKAVNIAQSEFTAQLNLKANRETLQRETEYLTRYFRRKNYRISLETNLSAEIAKADSLIKKLNQLKTGSTVPSVSTSARTSTTPQTQTQAQRTFAQELRALDKTELQKIYKAAAEDALLSFEEGIANNKGKIATALNQAAQEASAGFIAALQNEKSALFNAAGEYGNSLLSGLKKTLKIESPSREMFDIGDDAGKGFELGLIQAMEAAERTATSRMRRMLDRLARMALIMGGMSGAEISSQIAQARALPSVDFPSTVPPARGVPIGPSATGRALTGVTQNALPGGSRFAAKYLPTDLGDELKRILRGAAYAFVDSLSQRVRQVSVREIGQAQLAPSRVAGLLPSAVGRPPNVYATGAIRSESRAAMFTRREQEARMRSALRGAELGQHFTQPLRLSGTTFMGDEFTAGGGRDRVRGFGQPPERGGAIVPYGPRAKLPPGYLTGGKIQQALKGADQYLKQSRVPLTGAIQELGGEFGNAVKQVLLFGTAYKALAFIIDIPNQALAAATALQSFRNQIEALTPNAAEAERAFTFIEDIARQFKVPLDAARQGFVRLYASMEPAGISTDVIEGLFIGISKAAATLDMSEDKVNRVIYAFSQMASKGKLSAEEVTNQLGDVIPGALSLMADSAQMEMSEFIKAMENGQLSGEAVGQVMNNVAVVLDERFGKGAKGAANSLRGLRVDLQNNTKLMYEAFTPLVNIFASRVLPVLNAAIKDATGAIKAFGEKAQGAENPSEGLSDNALKIYTIFLKLEEITRATIDRVRNLLPLFAGLGTSILFAADAIARFVNTPIGGALADLGIQVTIAISALQGISKLVGVVQAVTTSVKGLFTVLGIGSAVALAKIALIVGAVVGIGAAIKKLYNSWEPFNNAVNNAGQFAGAFFGEFINGTDGIASQWQKSVENMSALWNGFIDGASSAFQALGDFFNEISQFIQRVWENTIIANVNKAREGSELINSVFEGIGNFFSQVTSFIRENWANMLSAIVNGAANALNPLASTFKALFGIDIGKAVTSAIRGAASAFQDAGGEGKAPKAPKTPTQPRTPLSVVDVDLAGGTKGGGGGSGRSGGRKITDISADRLELSKRLFAAQEAENKVAIVNLQTALSVLDAEENIEGVNERQRAILEALSKRRLDLKKIVEDEAEEQKRADEERLRGLEEINRAREEYNSLLLDAQEAAGAITPEAAEQRRREIQQQQAISRLGPLLTPDQLSTLRNAFDAIPVVGSLDEAIQSLKRSFDEMASPVNQLITGAQGIGDAFANSFSAVITGSMTAKEALADFFGNVARNFANMAAQLLSQWLVMKAVGLVGSLFGGGSPTSAGGAPSMPFDPGLNLGEDAGLTRLIGVPLTPYANGGVVKGPTLGLVGEGRYNEAIVPLPDGKSIPVELGGDGKNIVSNITVNVSNGQARTEGNSSGNDLGRKLEGAVKQVIIEELRPGGVLANRR